MDLAIAEGHTMALVATSLTGRKWLVTSNVSSLDTFVPFVDFPVADLHRELI